MLLPCVHDCCEACFRRNHSYLLINGGLPPANDNPQFFNPLQGTQIAYQDNLSVPIGHSINLSKAGSAARGHPSPPRRGNSPFGEAPTSGPKQICVGQVDKRRWKVEDIKVLLDALIEAKGYNWDAVLNKLVRRWRETDV